MLNAAEKVKALPVSDCEVDYGKVWPLVPDGEYQAILTHYETAYFGRFPKVYLHFRLIDPPEYTGKELFRAYPVKGLIGKPWQARPLSLEQTSAPIQDALQRARHKEPGRQD